MAMVKNGMRPVHPGEILREDYLVPLGLSANALARAADEDGLAILMASNDPLDALRHADNILVMSPGPGATIAETIAHDPAPDASDDELAASELHARLWRVLEG